ncbi:MAG TPA: hypothetical protein VJ852_12310 [Gemmatimonadaceae bacterium]|nr:hypothetical protein [Gemmatimonadaceae bacterium]
MSRVVARAREILLPQLGAGFRRASRSTLVTSTAVGLAMSVSCQRYVPIELQPKAVGTNIRVSLNEGAASTSFAPIGSRIHQAEGKLLLATDSTLAIGVSAVMRTNGIEDAWNGDTVVFERSQVVDVEQRRISRSRTLLSLAALVAGGILAHQSLNHGDRVVVGQPPPQGGN